MDKSIPALPQPENAEEALMAVVALRRMADQLERRAVAEAIAQGWSWSEVAELLGVSKQAAHKRHAATIKKNSTGESDHDVSTTATALT